VLFTSYRALEAAATAMRANCRYPVLVQGQMPKRELVEAFQSLGNAVLLGTSSFWEGVDVRGEALSCVSMRMVQRPESVEKFFAALVEQAASE